MRRPQILDAWGVIMDRRGNADRLVQQHMGFAHRMATRLRQTLPAHVDADALESDAMLGLLMAARSFDPGRGAAFTTYAGRRIRGAMLDGLRDRKGCGRHGRPPVMLSLSAPIGTGEDHQACLGDVLADRSEPVGAALEQRDQVEFLLRSLCKPSRCMIQESYLENMTQKEIGQRHGLSASRVSQILATAQARLMETTLSH